MGQWQVGTVIQASPRKSQKPFCLIIHLKHPRRPLPGPRVVLSLGLEQGLLIHPPQPSRLQDRFLEGKGAEGPWRLPRKSCSCVR